MQTKTKQQGATQAQLAHRALWLRLARHEKVALLSADLNTAHQLGLPFSATRIGDMLLDAMAEAGL